MLAQFVIQRGGAGDDDRGGEMAKPQASNPWFELGPVPSTTGLIGLCRKPNINNPS